MIKKMMSTCKMKLKLNMLKLSHYKEVMNCEIKITTYILCLHVLSLMGKEQVGLESLWECLIPLLVHSWIAILSVIPLDLNDKSVITVRMKPGKRKKCKIEKKIQKKTRNGKKHEKNWKKKKKMFV